MTLGEEGSSDTGVGLGHGIAVDHATNVASVTRDLLSAHLVGRASDPVHGELAGVAEDIFVHFGAGGEIDMAVHALLQGNAAHVLFVAAGGADLLVNSAGSLAEQVVLEGDVSSVAGEVLTGPAARGLGTMLRGLGSSFAHF